ncbi:lanthionine synthetase C family protein [Sciscionella marina]|uniref:lanthionine synthetase C family protein n=1 Tax=Sciscionella marina TaxID=508770 RepID=UPI000A065862|nr:lanthionine synthetase C family protein [Sciscionella marina]
MSTRSVRLGAVLAATAERLADPATTCPQGPDGARWPTLDSQIGLALFYAELGHADPGLRPVAHRYLAAANAALSGTGRHTLSAGVPALAFAACAAAHRDGEYATLLAGLDAAIFGIVGALLDEERKRLASGTVAPDSTRFDLLAGLAGLGRYLLCRCPASAQAEALLREILDYYRLLVRPVTDRRLPGWWVACAPDPSAPPGAGHANLGMAHGIPGPLALLAVAWRNGVRVDRHIETVETIVEFLRTWSDTDERGRYWPAALAIADYTDRPVALPRPRPAWCYGAPGVARAVQLAGLAAGRPDWLALARQAVHDLPEPETETGVCHGTAGLLQLAVRMQADDPACGLTALADRLAEHTAATLADDGNEDPGLLTGTTGAALALHTHGTGTAPSSGWDGVLLIG